LFRDSSVRALAWYNLKLFIQIARYQIVAWWLVAPWPYGMADSVPATIGIRLQHP